MKRRRKKRARIVLGDAYILEHISRYEDRSTRQIYESIVADYGAGIHLRTIERNLRRMRIAGTILFTAVDGNQNLYRRPKNR